MPQERNVVDLTGKQFHELKVLELSHRTNRKIIWKCLCSCGTIVYVKGENLKSGNTKSCGHLKSELAHKRCFVDLTGKVFGRLTVIKLHHKIKIMNKRGGYKYFWECKCTCKSTCIVSGECLKQGKTRSCGCLSIENLRNRYQGTKDISGVYFCSIKNDAQKRNLEFKITKNYIQQLLEQQNYRCALSGINICGSKCKNKKDINYQEQTASLDRIDSNKGYIEGNIQWVHKDINIAKQKLSDEHFINLCTSVANHNKKTYIKKVLHIK